MLTNQLARLGVVPVKSNHPPDGRLRDHKHLEGDHKRSVGVKHSTRSSDTLPLRTSSRGGIPHSTILSETKPTDAGRGSRALMHWSDKIDTQLTKLVLFEPFLVPKKDGGQRPVMTLKALDNFVRHNTSRWKDCIP